MNKFTSFIKKFIDKKTLKFLAVGVINTVVGAGIMFIFYNLLHVNYWISSAMNYVALCLISFFLNNFWTFGYKDKSLITVIKFVCTVAACYGIAYGVAKPLIKLILSGQTKHIQENVAMVTGMFLFMILNYFGQRFFAFNKFTRRKDIDDANSEIGEATDSSDPDPDEVVDATEPIPAENREEVPTEESNSE